LVRRSARSRQQEFRALSMRFTKLLPVLICVSLPVLAASGQTLDPDPDRIFISPLKWERLGGAPRSVKERCAYGTLTIFYLEGVYAEVSASFTRMSPKEPIGVNLNEGFVIRLGTWSRTYDEQLIRIEAKEVSRDNIIRPATCETVAGKQVCTPEPGELLPGPLKYSTCHLEAPSTVHIADTIVCQGLTVSHLRERIDLANFTDIVRRRAVQSGLLK